ncbi:S-layer homology domain-containing protein [Oscillibacter valericigenes]|nr:S-layer homology domain-containing protein [Oscillibacter valericigenes]
MRYGNGEADTTYTELTTGTTLALPTPIRTDYRFDGWYVNGNRYTNSYPVSGNAILVAQWTYVGSSSGSSSDPSYSPILDVSDGGSIKVNPRTPEEDEEVTITVDPDSGYEVDEVTVTDRNGREVKVTAERDGTYTFTQPRGRVTISVTFVREGGGTFFSDVPESFWAYDEIAWAYDNGYVNGTSASSFSPNASISRQQVWMILARLSGADPANMSAAREWAVTNGVSDGTTPGGAVTRQQLVALLYRYATLMGYANDQRADLSAYPDAGTVAGYAVEPMQWSVANSIVGGTSNGTLDPTGTATRAQFAVILYRFWDQVG